MGEVEFLSFYLNFRVGIMIIEVDELLKLLLNSVLFLPLESYHIVCTLGSDYKMKNYLTP